MELPEIMEMVDIAEYIGQYVELEERGEELWGISPFTDPPECTPSFSVRPAAGKFYDFSSGIGGNIVTFIKYYHKVSAYDAVRILKKYAGIEDNDSSVQQRSSKMAATRVCMRFAPKKQSERISNVKPLPKNYMERYEIRDDKLQTWRKEGISDETMRFFDVKYDAFSNCIVYPIRNTNGDIVNIGGRTLDPDFKAKGIRKYTYFKPWKDYGGMQVVYGLFENADEIQRCREVIIFEGVKSVFIAREYGFKNCGAILTSHLNPSQMKIIAKLGVPVVFALDKDVDPTKDRNIQTLRRYSNVYFIRDDGGLLGEKDSPVDKGRDTFYELYSEYRFKF